MCGSARVFWPSPVRVSLGAVALCVRIWMEMFHFFMHAYLPCVVYRHDHLSVPVSVIHDTFFICLCLYACS